MCRLGRFVLCVCVCMWALARVLFKVIQLKICEHCQQHTHRHNKPYAESFYIKWLAKLHIVVYCCLLPIRQIAEEEVIERTEKKMPRPLNKYKPYSISILCIHFDSSNYQLMDTNQMWRWTEPYISYVWFVRCMCVCHFLNALFIQCRL